MKSLLFKAEMIRAIIAGNKTQTRRISTGTPRLQIGDVVAARETWWQKGQWHLVGNRRWEWDGWEPKNGQAQLDMLRRYDADGRPEDGIISTAENRKQDEMVWRKRTSIHMPDWAVRVHLKIVGVRMERLNDISAEDAIAEGLKKDIDWWFGAGQAFKDPRHAFADLWDFINKEVEPWAANPMVDVYAFNRVHIGVDYAVPA